ncbi:alpha/beta hydrolase [Kitasatospora sp. CM 4170]|uniref:Alpha/beta hydrolase fold domain-containing protein n=1 Tax=Kitasatospora aburaviensis TaxID=67265 RepID=A0ABW1F4K6_9ACTN|nr:alpha/beta hydrolase [Kitasatospora sp. CM 4170]WNM47761.1 alpha/beta hydrolase [Kitasatospora sp. CM 4170]
MGITEQELSPEGLADAELAAFVEAVRRDTGPTARESGAEAVRAAQRLRVRSRPVGPEVAEVREAAVGRRGLPVRLYRPAPRPHGVVVFLHGGMWTIGDLDSHDRLCRRLALATGAVVVAVDYRRAPEHPAPAAVDDAVDAVRWAAAEQVRGGEPLIVMGDSAGGHLAALACLRLRDEGGPLPQGQVLAYPNTDLTLSHPSVREKGTGWGLSADDLAWGVEGWVPDPALRADPAVSPLRAADHTGLPPAVVVTAEHDPLRDEGDAYAAVLAAAGVPVRHRREPGVVHGFLTMDTLSPAAAALGDRLFADVAELITGAGAGPGPGAGA